MPPLVTQNGPAFMLVIVPISLRVLKLMILSILCYWPDGDMLDNQTLFNYYYKVFIYNRNYIRIEPSEGQMVICWITNEELHRPFWD